METNRIWTSQKAKEKTWRFAINQWKLMSFGNIIQTQFRMIDDYSIAMVQAVGVWRAETEQNL